MSFKRLPWRQAAPVAALFALALALRGLAPAGLVTWDEPAWVYRSVAFLTALQRGDLASTLQVGHPGVVTMWSGALSLAWHRYVTGAVAQAQIDAILAVPWQVHDVALLRQLTQLLPLAKGTLPWLHGGILLGIYALVRRLTGPWEAFAAALLLLADPFYLALARVLHLDALTAGWMLLALLSLALYLREGRRGQFALAGVCLGLGLLTKSYALLVAPVGGALLLIDAMRRRGVRGLWRALGRAVALGLAWLGVAAATFCVLWPSMWVAPGATLRAMAGLSLQYAAQEAGATATFYLGRVVEQVGAGFYPVALWFRATPFVVLGLPLALTGLVWPHRKETVNPAHGLTMMLLGFAISYLAGVSLGLKKFDRYALPALLALDMAAVLGWLWLARLLAQFTPRCTWLPQASALGLIAAQGVLLLWPLFPGNTLAYYNPLAGGLRRAVQTLPVGWGEGLPELAQALAAESGAAERVAATWSVAALAAVYPGEILPLTEVALPQADEIVLYRGDLQAGDPLALQLMAEATPRWVSRVGGIEYAWAYDNPYLVSWAEALATQARPSDLAVANLPTAVQRRASTLAWLVAESADESALAEQLRRAVAQAGPDTRIHLLDFAAAPERGAALRRLLAENAVLAEETLVKLGALAIYSPLSGARWAVPVASQPLAAAFAGQWELVAYGQADQPVRYGQAAGVALRWRALAPTARDVHLSLRLVDAEDRRWAQSDGPLLAEGRATAPGDEVTVHRTVSVAAGMPPGEYWLEVGLYTLADGHSLGAPLRLASIRVVPGETQPTPQQLPAAVQREQDLGGSIRLHGYTLAASSLDSGEATELTLFWECLRAEPERPLAFAFSLLRGGQAVAHWQVAPAGAGYPSTRWRAGEMLRYPQQVAIPANAPSGDYTLRLTLVDALSGKPLSEGVDLAALDVAYRERLWETPSIAQPFEALFGQTITLLGYDLGATGAQPGEALTLTVYLRAVSAPGAGRSLFVHLLGPDGRVTSQCDGPPGGRPTSGWLTGEIVVAPCDLTLPEDAPTGDYRLELGFYAPATGERLEVSWAEGTERVHDPERRLLLPERVRVSR